MSIYEASIETSTPASPSPGRKRLYPKNDGFYVLDEAGQERQLAQLDTNSKIPVSNLPSEAVTSFSEEKTSLFDTDFVGVTESSNSNILKKLSWANLKNLIKTYYDSLTTTLTNKTIPLNSNTVTGTFSDLNNSITDATIARTDAAQTFTGIQTFTDGLSSKRIVFSGSPPNNVLLFANNNTTSQGVANFTGASLSPSLTEGTAQYTAYTAGPKVTGTTNITDLRTFATWGFNKDATATVDRFFGFLCGDPQGAIQATYGFYGAVSAGTNRFNIYIAGDALSWFNCNIQCTKAIITRSLNAAIGFGQGAGGTVTQTISKSTAVTLNKPCGDITMHAEALAANTTVSFILNNNKIAATDQVVITHNAGGTGGAYVVTAFAQAGKARIFVRNITNAPLSQAIVLRFKVIKGAVA